MGNLMEVFPSLAWYWFWLWLWFW